MQTKMFKSLINHGVVRGNVDPLAGSKGRHIVTLYLDGTPYRLTAEQAVALGARIMTQCDPGVGGESLFEKYLPKPVIQR